MLLPIELIFLALIIKFALALHLLFRFWRAPLWYRFLWLTIPELLAIGGQIYAYWVFYVCCIEVANNLLTIQALLRAGLFISLLVWSAKDILILRLYKAFNMI